MIFVNKNADYSANSIGKVVVPIHYEKETLQLLSQVTRNVDDAKKTALNILVRSLKSKGLYQYIDMLSLPYFSANPAEATRNLATNTPSDYTDSLNSYYKMEEYGLSVKRSQTVIPSASTPMPFNAKRTACISYFLNENATHALAGAITPFYFGYNSFFIV